VHRFLARLWRLSADVADRTPDEPVPGTPSDDDLELLRKAHWAVEKVTNDLAGRFAFNTAIAAIMELTNTCSRQREEADPSPGALRFALATAASLLFPFAPHAASDAYERLTGRRVWEEPWPTSDHRYLERDTYELVCQVNGKVRDRVQAPTGAAREELEALCLGATNVRAHIDGRDVVKVVVVPERLVNVVVR
jgi:leucyl-tRNA synthetase